MMTDSHATGFEPTEGWPTAGAVGGGLLLGAPPGTSYQQAIDDATYSLADVHLFHYDRGQHMLAFLSVQGYCHSSLDWSGMNTPAPTQAILGVSSVNPTQPGSTVLHVYASRSSSSIIAPGQQFALTGQIDATTVGVFPQLNDVTVPIVVPAGLSGQFYHVVVIAIAVAPGSAIGVDSLSLR
jgi:hypothetical protein